VHVCGFVHDVAVVFRQRYSEKIKVPCSLFGQLVQILLNTEEELFSSCFI